ncbi:hypothetical protein JKG47_17560 [Acidithiobacillus sp. MC6.1]|nr:hypothetical protein [Acidithiobacillus sp. MC6.1]
MAESHVISGLVTKRSELDGIIQFHRNEIQRLSGDVGHIDAAIKLFEPDYDLRTIKATAHREGNPYFEHGDISKMILDALRVSGDRALSTRELGEHLILANGLSLAFVSDWQVVLKPVLSSLKRLEKKSVVKMVGRKAGGGHGSPPMLWQIV